MTNKSLVIWLLCMFPFRVFSQDDIEFVVKAKKPLYIEFNKPCLTSLTSDTFIIHGLPKSSTAPFISFRKGNIEMKDSICIVTPYGINRQEKPKKNDVLYRLFGGISISSIPGKMDSGHFYLHLPGDSGGQATIRQSFCISPGPTDYMTVYWGSQRMYSDRQTKMTPTELKSMLHKTFTYRMGDSKKHYKFKAVSLCSGKLEIGEAPPSYGSALSTTSIKDLRSKLEKGPFSCYVIVYAKEYDPVKAMARYIRLIPIGVTNKK